MFKKTRNRILLLNMLMVSSVVIVVFVAIFVTTYSRVQNENRERLLFSPPLRERGAVRVEYAFEEFPESSEPRILYDFMTVNPSLISPRAGVSFSVLVDSDTNVMGVDSFFDLAPETYTRVATVAMGERSGLEIVSIDGRMWQYLASPVTTVSGWSTVESGTVYVNSGLSGDFTQIRVVDVTDSHRMLQSLAFTLSGSALVVLAVFFFISRYFAHQAVKPMEEAWEKQRRFIADASHELKTPLSVISANCSVLYANKDETLEGQLRWVDSISRASDRMTGLVGSLLSLAGMEDTRLELNHSPFDLGEEITAAISEMEAVALEKGLDIHRTIEPYIVIESDREQVHKILSILLDNAVKYTDSGGEVTVSLNKEKRHIVCAVRNSGAGIPPDDLPLVFDRFYRGDPARSSENNGYGLGLAIAKSIADQLGVSLSAGSKEGEYTEFRLMFDG